MQFAGAVILGGAPAGLAVAAAGAADVPLAPACLLLVSIALPHDARHWASRKLCGDGHVADQLNLEFWIPASFHHLRKRANRDFLASLCSASSPYSFRWTTTSSWISSWLHA